MKKFWEWILSIFGVEPTKIPSEIYEDTTAQVIPDEYKPEEVETILNETKLEGTSSSKMDGDHKMDVTLHDAPPIIEEEKIEASKYAVIIGINKYDPLLDADLNGCVNDAEAMFDILTNTYNFPKDNIRMLTDFRATRQAIYDHISWLITQHKAPGDELVLHYSGHGSQVRDRDGDELADELDEILCPTDLDWDNPFTDDDLAVLFKQKAEDVNLTFICDSCHSGTMTREFKMTAVPTSVEFMSKARFIKPPTDILYRSVQRELPLNTFGAVDAKVVSKTINQKHVLLSGCRDDQTSADAYIEGRWQGALTSSLVKAIKNNPYRDWTTIHADVVSILNVGGYTQRPQLSGNEDLVKVKSIFGA